MHKHFFLIMALLACAFAARAQEGDRVNVPLSDPSRPAVIKASLLSGGITVTGYNGKEVIVEARARGHENERPSKPNPKADGLRRLDTRGSGLSIDEGDNVVKIGVHPGRAVDLVIQAPFNSSLNLNCLNDGSIQVEHISGEIEVSDLNGPVKLTNISGTVVAHSLNADVTVVFDQITPGKPMSFSSLNGDVDVTMPADTKARVKMKSDNGEIYSDFEIRQEAGPNGSGLAETNHDGGRFRVRFDKTMYGSINGGGPEIEFTTMNGKIYLRKKK